MGLIAVFATAGITWIVFVSAVLGFAPVYVD
jgi:hypothetical protein